MKGYTKNHKSKPSCRYRSTDKNDSNGDTSNEESSHGVLPHKQITLLVLVASTASWISPHLQQGSLGERLIISILAIGLLFFFNWAIDVVMVN